MGKINGRLIKDYIDKSSENVLMKKFPGHTAEEMEYYSNFILAKESPDKVIIVAGTNDLSRHYYEKGAISENDIISKIIGIAKNAKNYGTKEIYISGLMIRRGRQYEDSIKGINQKLKELCIENGFKFWCKYLRIMNKIHLKIYDRIDRF